MTYDNLSMNYQRFLTWKGDVRMMIYLKSKKAIINPSKLIAQTGMVFTMSLLTTASFAYTLTGEAKTEAVSGFSGTAYQIGNAEGERAVYGLWSVERNDKPCYFASMTEDINDSSDDSGGLKDLCGKKATSKTMKAEFSDAKFNNHTFIRSLRVCMNDKNTRVKGFQIKGRTIEDNGQVVNLPSNIPGSGTGGLSAFIDLNAPSDQRPNCNGKWKKWSKCPDGKIATALQAHFSAGSTPRSLTGIAVICRSVTQAYTRK